MKSGRSGAHKPDQCGLSCKANKCSDVGTGDPGVLFTYETSMKLVMPTQPAQMNAATVNKYNFERTR